MSLDPLQEALAWCRENYAKITFVGHTGDYFAKVEAKGHVVEKKSLIEAVDVLRHVLEKERNHVKKVSSWSSFGKEG